MKRRMRTRTKRNMAEVRFMILSFVNLPNTILQMNSLPTLLWKVMTMTRAEEQQIMLDSTYGNGNMKMSTLK